MRALGLFFLIFVITYLGQSDGKVCESDLCKKLVRELKISMDNNADPCDDMSSYICGNFDKLHSIPPGEVRYDWSVEMGAEINIILKDLLEKQDLSNKNKPQAKAAIFYKSCLDMSTRNKNSKQTIEKFVNRIMGKSDFEKKLVEIIKSGMSSRFLGVLVLPDFADPTYDNLIISSPSLILGQETLKTPESPTDKKTIELYKAYMGRVLNLLGISDNNEVFINEIVKLHIRVAQSLPTIEEQSNPDNYNNKLKIRELQSRCPQISWKAFINGILSNSKKQLNDDDSVMVFSLTYLDKLCPILQEYLADPNKKKVLENDLKWAAIDSLVPYGSSQLVDVYEELMQQIFGTTGRKDLWKKCLDLTSQSLIDIMGHMYVKKEFPVSKKKDIESMINNIRDTLKNVMESSTWMDPTTKASALIKLNAIKYKIGYPDSLLSEEKLMTDNQNVVIDIEKFIDNHVNCAEKYITDSFNNIGKKIPDDRWEMGAHEVNAYYNPSANEIVFPAAILRYPFYDITMPVTYNYGSIGMVLGHEFLHGFDNAGSKYDEKGHIRNWWSQQSREAYETKTKCIINQYESYSIHNKTLPAAQTLPEDIADNGGTRMAYLAVFSSLETKEKLTLPELNFTPEQLFFVGNAKTWCSLYTKNGLLESMKEEVHTVWKFRINGPQSNMPEFSKNFKCERNKEMNRLKKCLVW